MKKHILILLMLLSATTLWARKPADTLSAGRWEFVQNLGQWNSSVRFSARMSGGALFFGNNFLTVTQLHPGQLEENREAKHNGKPFPFLTIDAAAYRVTFLNANPAPAVEGVTPYDHYYNYYIGNPKQWASHVSAYHNIRYVGLYDQTDLLFLSDNDYLKYEFHIAPGGDPSQIKMQYDGLTSISKVGEELLLYTAVDRILELNPFAYQIDKKGDTIPITCHYHLQKNILTFDLGDYDPTLTLVIDPTVVFSSYSGSTADNCAYDAKTGEVKKEHDLTTPFYSSPVVVDGKVYLFSNSGKVYIFSASTFDLITSFETGEKTFATPAFTDGMMIVRTDKSLYCVKKS